MDKFIKGTLFSLEGDKVYEGEFIDNYPKKGVKIFQYIILMELLNILGTYLMENIMDIEYYLKLYLTIIKKIYMKVNLKMDFIMDQEKEKYFKINIENFYLKEIL